MDENDQQQDQPQDVANASDDQPEDFQDRPNGRKTQKNGQRRSGQASQDFTQGSLGGEVDTTEEDSGGANDSESSQSEEAGQPR